MVTRRELLLVSLTAAVCFAIAIPIGGAATQARTPVTVEPGGSVLFPNLDWQCWSAAKTTGTDSNGQHWTIPAAVSCSAPGSGRTVGKRTSVSRNWIAVFHCTNGNGDCPALGKWKRTP